MSDKLILPAEIKVCATCSYWDGERHVDEEVNVVVVDRECSGECLVQQTAKPGIHDVRCECLCLWEDLAADEAPPAEEADRPA